MIKKYGRRDDMPDFLKNVRLIAKNMGKLIDPFRGSTYYRMASQGGMLVTLKDTM